MMPGKTMIHPQSRETVRPRARQRTGVPIRVSRTWRAPIWFMRPRRVAVLSGLSFPKVMMVVSSWEIL